MEGVSEGPEGNESEIVKIALSSEYRDHGQWEDFNWYTRLDFIAVGSKVEFKQENLKIMQKHVKIRVMRTW